MYLNFRNTTRTLDMKPMANSFSDLRNLQELTLDFSGNSIYNIDFMKTVFEGLNLHRLELSLIDNKITDITPI